LSFSPSLVEQERFSKSKIVLSEILSTLGNSGKGVEQKIKPFIPQKEIGPNRVRAPSVST
jgi:hypothetical protein